MHTLELDRELTEPKHMTTNPQARPAFGTVLADHMSMATFRDGKWGNA